MLLYKISKNLSFFQFDSIRMQTSKDFQPYSSMIFGHRPVMIFRHRPAMIFRHKKKSPVISQSPETFHFPPKKMMGEKLRLIYHLTFLRTWCKGTNFFLKSYHLQSFFLRGGVLKKFNVYPLWHFKPLFSPFKPRLRPFKPEILPFEHTC